jgi:hypothetical protein
MEGLAVSASPSTNSPGGCYGSSANDPASSPNGSSQIAASPPGAAAIDAARRCVGYAVCFDACAVAPSAFSRRLFNGYVPLTGTGRARGSIISPGTLTPYTGSKTGRI